MKDSETDKLDKKISKLEKEYSDLKNQFYEDSKNTQEAYSYKIFIEARKKFLSWLALPFIFITVFGYISVNTLIKSIKNQVEKKGVEKIIQKVKSDTKEDILKSRDEVINNAIDRITPQIKSTIEENIREEILFTFKISQSNDSISSQADVLKSLKESYEKRHYYVFAASSKEKSELERIVNRVRKKMGSSEFNTLFPNTKILEEDDNDIYSIRIGSKLTLSEAKKIKELAITYGFRKDTFIMRAKEN